MNLLFHILFSISTVLADMWIPKIGDTPISNQWAVLVASSNGWDNYRHQADVCHAYHVLRQNGIPEDHIITMMYDDIANNTNNPYKGVIINKPGGPNVYEGVKKDYVGKEVNVENFLNILKGNKEAMEGKGTGRVLQAGPNDNVFLNIVDHGFKGGLSFPNDGYLLAQKFADTLTEMKRDLKFGKMIIYLEACHAGSMFDNIIDNRMDVFVVTASAPDEVSYAAYYNETLDLWVGDLYSVTWMEQMDTLRKQWSDRFISFFKQYRNVRTDVKQSHVMMYGDFRLGFEKLSDFMGSSGFFQMPFSYFLQESSPEVHQDSTPVSSLDLPFYRLRRKMERANTDEERKHLAEELQKLEKGRKFADETIDRIMVALAGEDGQLYLDLTYKNPTLTSEVFPCYENVIKEFNRLCFNTHRNPYLHEHFPKLANICFMGVNDKKMSGTFSNICGQEHRDSTDIL